MASDNYSYSIQEDDKEGQELYEIVKQYATRKRLTMSGIILHALKLYVIKEIDNEYK